MLDDRGPCHPFRGRDRLALHAVLRIGGRALVGALRDPDALEPDGKPREIHHDEHVLEAAVLFADEVTGRSPVVAVRHDRRGARVDAELVLQRDAVHVVARAEAAVVVDEDLGHDEQRDPLDALRRIRRAREHEVDDVVGVVVLAVGDEDLLAEELVRPVALRHGARAHGGEVRAGLRLRQVHGPGPGAGHHLRQEPVLELLRAAQRDRLDRALRQHRAEIEGEVRRMPHLLDGGPEEVRQPLAAVVGRLDEPVPAVLAELQVRGLESGRRLHRAVGKPLHALAVADAIERIEHVGRELRRFVEDRRDHVGCRLLVSGEPGDLFEPGELVHDEPHFGEGGLIGAHRESPACGRTLSPAPR